MSTFPRSYSRQELEEIIKTGYVEHVCIDKYPFAEFALRIWLETQKITPDPEVKVYCYQVAKEVEAGHSVKFLYVDEETHLLLLELIPQARQPCEEANSCR